jgi:hypothetical protein
MSSPQTPAYRPAFVTQRDGSKLANSNCRMASIAMGVDLETKGADKSTGSKMRSYTDDQSGGTDSGDARQAWDRGYDQSLTVRDGNTFDQALADLRAYRAVHLDVWHAACGGPCLSGSGAYGHTIMVLPDYNADGWLVGDPWCTNGYHRWPESKLRKGAEQWGAEVYGRAADEPDYPSDSSGPRDPRVIVIVARIVKRLMSSADPDKPYGTLQHPGETGGGSILYTVTHPTTAKGGSDLGISYRPQVYADPGVALYLDSSCTNKITTTTAGGELTTLGGIAKKDDDGTDYTALAVLVTTGQLRTDGGQMRAVLWAKRADLPDAATSEVKDWQESIWQLAHDDAGRYPCADPGQADELAARRAQWDSDATALLGARPS